MIDTVCRVALELAGARPRRLSIAIFHRVLAQPDPIRPYEPDRTRFNALLTWLKGSFTILPLREGAARLFDGSLPARALCVTFDDGYRDNVLNALPILRRHGVPATFFITTKYMEGGMMWNDRIIEALRNHNGRIVDLSQHGLGSIDLGADADRAAGIDRVLQATKYLPYARRDSVADELFSSAALPGERMMMNADEVRQLHKAGMEIGGHTVGHPILTLLDDTAACAEIRDNKASLEDIIGEPVFGFAYPNGQPGRDYEARHVTTVRDCDYRYAVSTARGCARANDDTFQLPRFTPWEQDRVRFLLRLVQNYFRTAESV